MNFWPVEGNRGFWSSLLMVLTVLSITGCKAGKENWIDNMITDVETAFMEADKAGLWQEGRDAAMAREAHKYFPVGMRKGDAFVLLQEMQNNGFDITEYRYEGSRVWSGGELRPYRDEATRRNLQRQYPLGISEVVAIRRWQSRIVVEEFFSIGITIPDDSGLILRVSVERSAGFI